MRIYFFLVILLSIVIIPAEAISQGNKSIYLKVAIANVSNNTAGNYRFDLYIYSDSALLKVYPNIPVDTSIKVSGKPGLLYKASVHRLGFSNTDAYWKYDTVKINQVKTINITSASIQLNEVNVKAEREAYKRGDTLVIPVDQIKTKPHATATELLEKIPGFSIGTSGSVSAMGKKVNKVKVDGVEVFGGNAKATLENLRSDMLRDVEVSNLTGDSGSGVEVNLKLKKDRKEGLYGDLYGQYGTHQRKNFGLKFNKIKPSSFINAFFNYNNQNQQVLSPNEYLQMVGFNSSAAGTLGTQKLYYDFKLEDPFDNLNNIGDRFPFLEKGIHKTYSTGLNYSKQAKAYTWNTYVLGSSDQNQITERSDMINNLGVLTTRDNKDAFNQLKNFNATGQSAWKWTPGEKNIIEAKLIFQTRKINNNPIENSNSKLFNSVDSVVNQALINNNQQVDSRSNMGYFKVNWEHRYAKPAEKTTVSVGTLLNHTTGTNIYSNFIVDQIDTSAYTNQVKESNNGYNYFANIQHSLPLSRKLLVDFRLNTLVSKTNVNRIGTNLIAPSIAMLSQPLSVSDFQIRDNQTTLQAFLFYKAGSLSLIGGIGGLKADWNVSSKDSLYNHFNKVSVLPAAYINYNFGRSKVSLKYAKERAAPALANLLPVTDSSRVQQVTQGNPVLNPFFSNKLELISDVFVHGIGAVNLSISYAKTNEPVSDNIIYSTGYFPLKTFSQFRNSQEVTGTISYFNFSPGRFLNPYLFVFYLWRKQYQQNGPLITPVELNAISPQVGLKMNISKQHNLNLSIQSMINRSGSAGISRISSNRFNVDLKDDGRISDELYYNVSAKWILIYANSNYSVIKPVTNFNLYQYVGKEKKWQISYGVRNLLNVNQIKLINTGITQQTTSAYNYLSRYFNVGVTYFPEKWKKATP